MHLENQYNKGTPSTCITAKYAMIWLQMLIKAVHKPVVKAQFEIPG